MDGIEVVRQLLRRHDALKSQLSSLEQVWGEKGKPHECARVTIVSERQHQIKIHRTPQTAKAMETLLLDLINITKSELEEVEEMLLKLDSLIVEGIPEKPRMTE